MVFEVMLGVGWFDERQLHLTLFDGCADADDIWQVVGLAGPIIGLNLKGQNRAPAVPPEDYLSFMYFTFLFLWRDVARPRFINCWGRRRSVSKC